MKKAIRIIFTIIVVAGISLTTVYLVFEPSFLGPPEAPENEETPTVADGFYNEGGGEWFYYENGSITQKTDTIQGTVNEKSGLWQVVNGMVDFTITSLEKTDYNKWQYIKNGEVTEETDKSVTVISGKVLNEINGEKEITTFGNFEISAEEEIILKNQIRNITSKGNKLGFVVMNMNSLSGFAYNADEKIYSASTIKGPYVASLVKSDNSILEKEKMRIEATLIRSSNSDYETMRDEYGDDCFLDFVSQTGSSLQIDTTRNFQYLTPRTLTQLWIGNYFFFESAEAGDKLGMLFEKPVVSPIREVFSDEFITRTKAGWVEKNNTRVTNDAGIVYTDNGDFIIAIMTTAPQDLTVVEAMSEAIKTVIIK